MVRRYEVGDDMVLSVEDYEKIDSSEKLKLDRIACLSQALRGMYIHQKMIPLSLLSIVIIIYLQCLIIQYLTDLFLLLIKRLILKKK
jgi:hypothetical protein